MPEAAPQQARKNNCIRAPRDAAREKARDAYYHAESRRLGEAPAPPSFPRRIAPALVESASQFPGTQLSGPVPFLAVVREWHDRH